MTVAVGDRRAVDVARVGRGVPIEGSGTVALGRIKVSFIVGHCRTVIPAATC